MRRIRCKLVAASMSLPIDFGGPMHILAGRTALNALRSIRYSDIRSSLAFFEPYHAVAWLPGQPPRTANEAERPSESPCRTLEEAGFPFHEVEAHQGVDLWPLGSIEPMSANNPLELAVFDRSKAPHTKKSRGIVLKPTLPEDAIVKINPLLSIVAPELIVVQLAARLTTIKLCQLIMELCGTYSPCPLSDPQLPACRYDIPAVTTFERIRANAERGNMTKACRRVIQALDVAMEGAASPAETILALALSLPAASGGYGFPKPKLNARLDTPKHELDRVASRRFYLDVFWQDAFVDVEYESTEFHLDPLVAQALVAARDTSAHGLEARRWRRDFIAKADADRRRMRDLQYLGAQVIPATAFDLGDVKRMDQLAFALARRFEAFPSSNLELPPLHDCLGERDYRSRRERLLMELRVGDVV
jgi:hypothetical protein